MWKVIDRWQTQNGSWVPDEKNEYGIDQEHADFYDKDKIPNPNHPAAIFVKARRGMRVSFRDSFDGGSTYYTVPEGGWVSHHIDSDDSTFYPSQGQRGPWIVSVDGIDVADNIGLPDGLDVSTFLVMGNDRSPVPTPVPGKPKAEAIPGEWKKGRVIISVDGVTMAWEAMVRRDG